MRFLLLILGTVTWHLTIANADDFTYVTDDQSTNYNVSGVAREKATEAVIKSANAFSTKFYKAVANTTADNLVSTPLSALMVLSMLAFGANGTTKIELRDVLELPVDDNLAKVGFQTLNDRFIDFFEYFEFILANKIYLRNDTVLKSDFNYTTNEAFRSETETLDFSQSEEAVRKINAWCARKTENHIKELFNSGDINSDTSLVLVNTIYLMADWVKTFPENQTKNLTFHVHGGKEKDVETMHVVEDFDYGVLAEVNATFVKLDVQIVGSDTTSMFVILPNEYDGLHELERNIEKVTIDKLYQFSRYRQVNMSLPKFKFETTIQLDDPLKTLGLKNMFTDVANFDGIVENTFGNGLAVSKTIQKAFIEVDEKKVGAGAATASSLLYKNLGKNKAKTRVEFNADHPFICIITSERTRIPFFMARYTGSEL